MQDIQIITQKLESKIDTLCPTAQSIGWVSSLSFSYHKHKNCFAVTFPHIFFASWFAQHMQVHFEKALYEIAAENNISLSAIIYKNPIVMTQNKGFSHNSSHTQAKDFFEEFIYNTKNTFPVDMAREISKNPFSAMYNPFIIYGKTGVGKTQILHCIENAIQAQHPSWQQVQEKLVAFLSLEDLFELLKNTGAKRTAALYRVFIIDKLQNSNKNILAQEDFLYFIEICVEQKKQLIFASSISPDDEKSFTPALRSRLHAGLVVQLKHADIDVRMRFVTRQCKTKGIKLSKEQMLLLAQRCKNISLLQGVILKIFAYQNQYTQKLQTIDIEKILLASGEEEHIVTPHSILSELVTYFEITEEQILSDQRSPDIVRARQISMYLCRDILGLSYPTIGKFFGGKDHSTVIYAIKKIKKLTDRNKHMQKIVTEVKKKCLSQ